MSFEIRKLSEVAEIIMGQSPDGNSYNINGIGLPLLNGAADYKGKVFNPKKFTSSPSKIAIKGDILLGIRATIGNLSISDKDYCIGRGLAAIRIDETKINREFLIHFLSEQISKLINEASGSTIKGIVKEDLFEMQISLPPLTTQKRIADILDAADALRQKDQELLKKYDELAQAIFIDMFGDIMTNHKNFPIERFGNVCEELFLGLTSKVDYVKSDGYPLIRATDINKGVLSFKNVKYISESQHKKLTSRRITKRGDVLISKSGTLGTCAIVNSDREFSTYESIFTVRPNKDKLNNIFLISLVRNPSFQEELVGGKVGAGVSHLNLNMLREFEFPLPPIEIQNEYEKIYLSLKKQKDIEEENLGNSSKLFYGLIQKAFNGELVA